MAADFDGASSERLFQGSPPVQAYPFTVGMWVNPENTNTDYLFTLEITDEGGYYLRKSTTFSILVDNTVSLPVASTGTVTANAWHYVIGRFVSATNRRISVLGADGTVSHAQSTTNVTPSASDRSINLGSLGASTYLDGLIAEYWIASNDIAESAAALSDGMVRQLAFGGPFSVPSIADIILEYRSLRNDPTAADCCESYFGAAGYLTWTNTNGVMVGPHPPLPYWYVKPGQTKRVLPA